MSYGKVHDVFWEDDRIDGLSDRAAFLALFLITGPHRNAIGCFRLGTGAISDLPRFGEWGIEGVSEALSELVSMRFIYRDDRTGWTFIRNQFKHDPVKGDKAAIHAAGLAAKIPTTTVAYYELYQRLNGELGRLSDKLNDKPGWPMREPSYTPSEGVSKGDSKPKPSPSPEPEPSPLPEPSPFPAPASATPDNEPPPEQQAEETPRDSGFPPSAACSPSPAKDGAKPAEVTEFPRAPAFLRKRLGIDYTDTPEGKSNRKIAWLTKVTEHARAEMMDEQFQRFQVGLMNDDPDAKRLAEEISTRTGCNETQRRAVS